MKFTQTNLVSDVKGQAPIHDPALINPWGIAIGKTVWVSDAGSDLSTVYSGAAGALKKEQTEVWIPGGRPTGQVFNPTDEFVVKGKAGSGPASFITVSPSGAVTGWNAEADPKSAIIAAFTRGADYKGLALMETNRGPFLLAADFANGRIHVFDGEFDRVNFGRRAFRDPALPDNYHPFNVEVVGRFVYVAYALRDPETGKSVAGQGKGFVSRFSASGRFLGRLAARGPLNAPWAMTAAPKNFGGLTGAFLVGNFGDGSIHAYNPRNGRHLGALRHPDGRPITISGLWDLQVGTAENGGTNALWFSGGTDGGKHGLLGIITAGGTASQGTPTTNPTHNPNQHNSNNSNNNSGYSY
ncbi:TIGR03118 family protein [Thermocatellispora tengchongensis]|uniref:TIGR03118 family protein n=1 Tax=Thermocatellispora tengchongensis TaxID=1073253 RepID=UPI00363EF1E5